MTRSVPPDPRHEVTALLTLFIGGVVGALAGLGGRAWFAGNTYIAGVAGIGALAFIGIVILAQVSDWAFWRGETPEILDPERRAAMPRLRRYSLPIGFGAGLVLGALLLPTSLAGVP